MKSIWQKELSRLSTIFLRSADKIVLMRRITWVLVTITVILWVAIAIYWTGTGASQPKESDPLLFPVPSETPTPSSGTQLSPRATESALLATPSATPTLTPAVRIISPTVGLNFKY